jgi:glutamate/aspartate transport system ATP-binding protein
MIDVRGVSKSYGDFQVLKSCSVAVARGEVIVVCGPSGSGKSTLIKCVNGLEPFDAGEIVVDGLRVADRKEVQTLRTRIGMVFQNFELYPHLSALDNICLAPMVVLKKKRAEAEERARALLARVDLSEHATSTRCSSRAASSSGSPSPARSPWTRWSCCSTSRRRRSIPR